MNILKTAQVVLAIFWSYLAYTYIFPAVLSSPGISCAPQVPVHDGELAIVSVLGLLWPSD